MKWRSVALALTATCAAELAFSGPSGPPLETDDPDTPGDGNWEINFASTLEKR
ncbi:MAG: hypothetical protein ABR526_14155 [Chthoniobacterales bacterium]